MNSLNKWSAIAALWAAAFGGLASGVVAEEGRRRAGETEVVLPKDVPPVFATARATTKRSGDFEVLEVAISAPDIAWSAVDKESRQLKAAFWTEITCLVRAKQWVIRHGDERSQIPDSDFQRLSGAKMSLKEVAEALKNDAPVLLSITGKPVDPFYGRFMKPDTIAIVLARDDGMGDSSLIPRELESEVEKQLKKLQKSRGGE